MKLTDVQKKAKIAYYVKQILETLELPMNDPNFADTPNRVAKMYVEELFKGLNAKNKPKLTVFPTGGKLDQILVEKNILLNSSCAHHLVPFKGVCHIGYFPRDFVLGLSKFHRIVDYLASKPQVQENLTEEIAAMLKNVLKTDSVAVLIEAEHLCCKIRGVKDPNSTTLTVSVHGDFREPSTKAEFYKLVGK
jgi:GTP cyclohydrolase I